MKNSVKSCCRSENKIKIIYAVGIIFLTASAVFGIMFGSSALSFRDILNIRHLSPESVPVKILLYVRIPRMLGAVVCGSALAVSGSVIQTVLSNSLASPGIIGVNSGAGLAVTLCAAFGILGGWESALISFAGAFIAVMLINGISLKLNASRGTMILLGVALNSFFGAVTSAVITFIPDAGVMSNDFRVGTLSGVTSGNLLPAIIILCVVLPLLISLKNHLEVLSLGEETAVSLGMNTSLSRTVFLSLAALLAGIAVSIAGLISFVGLIVPHCVKGFAKGKKAHLLGFSAIYGGGFVCFCDTISRLIFSPYEIPVGIIMAFLGAPFFIYILIKGRGGNFID